jgi:hypothetical protein
MMLKTVWYGGRQVRIGTTSTAEASDGVELDWPISGPIGSLVVLPAFPKDTRSNTLRSSHFSLRD